MKKWLVSLLASAAAILPAGAAACTPAATADTAVTAADTLLPHSCETDLPRYERNKQRYLRRAEKLIPNQAVVQYAGCIGFLSAGIGWHYGRRDRWESEVLLGFVPRYESDCAKATLTVKERFVPWRLPMGRWWSVEPLTAGIYLNTIFGEDFWAHEPSRYPKSYYGFATKIRAGVFLGQRFRYHIPLRKRWMHKSIAFYYELGTSDLYIISAIPNKNVRLGDILSLSFGLTLDVF